MADEDAAPPGASSGSTDPYKITWDRWEEVDGILDRAMEAPDADLGQFLADACQGDEKLLAAVTDLLSATRQGEAELDQPNPLLVRAALDPPKESVPSGIEPGARVGRYRILSELGRGGMAVVFEAERADGAFEKRVALKVLRTGPDTDQLIRRSLAERQILAELEHVNIAGLLDGGTTADGWPFLVMELVEGEPVTDWAERMKLPVAERLRLFLQIVEAVAYAHGRLVVHRDLKPSNVLVTVDGLVKLLDFGVAKLLEAGRGSGDAVTRLGPIPMTPEFASPEQLRGERVTVVSDVFQLGALLHVLLTGERPFQDVDLQARLQGAARAPRPSDAVSEAGLLRSLRGDLDTIVQKALESAPADRYQSAESLAADLRSHLASRPIAARPASPWVRLRKFSTRNPWFWPVAATVTVGLAAYLGTVVRYSSQLEVQRAEAVAEAERAEALRGFMLSQFGAADPYSDDPVRPDVTVVEAMSLSAEAARRDLADQPLLQAEMLSAVAQVFSNLSLYGEARALLDEAMTVRRAHDADATLEQVGDLGLLGWVLGEEGVRDSARVLLIERLALERRLSGNADPRTADALERLGWHWFVDGEYEQSAQWYEEAVGIRRTVEPSDPSALSSSLAALADSYRRLDQWDNAREAATEAYNIARDEFGEEHPVTAGNKGHLAQVVHGMGDLEYAITLYREALPVLERTLGSQHASTLSNWNNLGIVLGQAGDLSGAEDVTRRILATRLDRYGTKEHREVAASLQNLAGLVVRAGRYAEADSLAQEAELIFRETAGPRHYSVGFSLITQAESALQRELGGRAERVIRRSIEILEPQFGSGFPTAAATCRLGRALGLQGRDEEAKATIAEALALMDGANGVPVAEIDLCRSGLEALEVSEP